jgi:hypothetical protein
MKISLYSLKIVFIYMVSAGVAFVTYNLLLGI